MKYDHIIEFSENLKEERFHLSCGFYETTSFLFREAGFSVGIHFRGAVTFYTVDGDYTLQDDAAAIAFMKALPADYSEKAKAVLSNTAFWGEDLNKIAGFADLLAADLKNIAEKGIEQATKDVL